MPKDSGRLVPLEQSMRRPGHWVVEGHDVKRVQKTDHLTGRPRSEDHHSPSTYTVWEVHYFGAHVGTTRTLNDARDLIAGRIERRKDLT